MLIKNNDVRVKELVLLFGERKCKVIGDIEKVIKKIAPISNAEDFDLVFCSYHGDKAIDLIKETEAKVIICEDDIPYEKVDDKSKTLILVTDARLHFARCMASFFSPPTKKGIHPTAIIGKNCIIGKDTYIGANATIGDEVKIGERTQIYPGVVIHDNVLVGNDVIIFSNVVIGADGFSHLYNEEGKLEKFPQLGSVRIEDGVEIGANSCVDRGTMIETVIGEGTKIDNLVQVGHNVQIGKNCFIVAHTTFAGGAILEDNVWIAPHACIKEHVIIGINSTVGMGAMVMDNVPANTVVAGIPAKPIKSSFRRK